MTDHDLDRILTSLKNDDGAHLGSISRNVMAQIASRRRRRAAALWMSLAAALAIGGYFAIPPTVAPPPLMVAGPLGPRLGVASSGTVGIVAHRTKRVARPLPAAAATSLEVRMQTDDPDVLIIWLVDGDEQKGHP